MFRWFLILLTAACIAGGVAYHQGLIPDLLTGFSTKINNSVDKETHSSVEIGAALYPKTTVQIPEWQKYQDPRRAQAIINDCQFEVIDKQDVTSIAGDGNKNGLILFIGKEAHSEELLGNDQGLDTTTFLRGDDKVTKKFRRWKEGDIVKFDEMLAMIDPSIALTDCLTKKAKVIAAQADWKASEAILVVYSDRVVTYENAILRSGKTAVSQEDLINTRLTRDKYAQEVVQKKEAINVAIKEFEASNINYKFHEIKNKIPGDSIIKYIYKNQGEGVKNMEPIMQLYNISKLRAQGSVEAQYFGQIAKGQHVIIEPSQEVGAQPLLKAHQGEITGVAVCSDNQRFVTGSEDKTVCIWRRGEDLPLQRLKHTSPVRSVACAPKGSTVGKSLCIVGCADGSIYLWDLDNFKQPITVLRDQHREAVTALAFSPKGDWFASGGSDGQINLWKTADGTLVYPFDSEHGANNGHQGAITSLHFTPQTRLVSASRDQSLRVWDLCQNGVKLHIEPIAGRGATVNQLGVSQDGQWMLFDQGKTLQLLSVDTGDAVSELKNPINAPAFETLALFSPDASLMLTAGATEGRLQLWRTPTPGARGYEVRHLVTTERSPVTCAAFSPNAGIKSDGFAVTGTKDGYVYLWANKKDSLSEIPTQEEVQKHRLGLNPTDGIKLTLVDQSTDSGKIRIGVDLENPQVTGQNRYRFIPGQRVTVVVVEE